MYGEALSCGLDGLREMEVTSRCGLTTVGMGRHLKPAPAFLEGPSGPKLVHGMFVQMNLFQGFPGMTSPAQGRLRVQFLLKVVEEQEHRLL